MVTTRRIYNKIPKINENKHIRSAAYLDLGQICIDYAYLKDKYPNKNIFFDEKRLAFVEYISRYEGYEYVNYYKLLTIK